MTIKFMSWDYIQQTYSVPAERGRIVTYSGDGEPRSGVITRENGSHIFIHFDGDKKERGPFHPTWELQYGEMGKLPQPPKMSKRKAAAKARYARFQDVGDSFNNFREFIGYDMDRQKAEALGYSNVNDYWNRAA